MRVHMPMTFIGSPRRKPLIDYETGATAMGHHE